MVRVRLLQGVDDEVGKLIGRGPVIAVVGEVRLAKHRNRQEALSMRLRDDYGVAARCRALAKEERRT